MALPKTASAKEKALVNFKKAQTHLLKIITMTEKNEYCVSIMQQNLAVIGLLKSANQMLLENHLKTCFSEGMKLADEKHRETLIEEMLQVTKLSHK